MNFSTQMLLAWELWKDWFKETFGSGVVFPTAPSFQPGYSK